MRRLAFIGALAMTWMSTSFGGEIDLVEDFALARDRAAVLKQLVPGTEEYNYYHALHYLQTEQFEKLDPLITIWVQRHGETQRVWEIRTRHALAIYDKNPQKTLDFLRWRLGLNFAHQKEELNAEPNLPTQLDNSVLSREAYINRANAITTDNTDPFEDTALDWLVGYELTPKHRRSLLARLSRPDYEKLLKHVIDDLKHEHSGGFGSLGIHRQLLVSQLEDLVKAMPDELNKQNFVAAYLAKLQPNPDEDWRHNPKSLEAYLDRLLKFTNRLAPAHNSLKAHVLYHKLVFDRQRGDFNKDRFLEYLKLPRQVGYLSRRILESDAFKSFPCDLTANYGGVTLLPPVGNDEPLVRSYLAHFLVDAPNTKEFEPYVNDIYLQHLLAEVKIVNGLGDSEQWASLLPPAQFQQLKERVDLDFDFSNKTQFTADEPVKLELYVKNVGTMIVKVFEINTKAYYRNQQREIDTDINLDGLVANVEQTHTFNEPPLRRVLRKFEFPQLDKSGVYIVDFIGNGRSSRALIRKGRLRHLVRTASVGQVFTILNDKSEIVKDATVWMAGHEYTAGKEGSILVPFSAAENRQPIVISSGGISSLDYFQHQPESIGLAAGFYVDRESLLKQKTATLIVRPSVTMNGTPTSVKVLEEVKLTINSTDLDDIGSSQEVPDFKLFEDRDSTYEFQVPHRLASLTFTLTAKAKRQSEGDRKIDLASSDTVSINGIDRTEKIESLLLLKARDGYIAELRGKTGEPRPSRAVQFSFKHRDFRMMHHVTLQTNPEGRIPLGPLVDIVSIHAISPDNSQYPWTLPVDAHTYSQTLNGKAGEPIVIPYLTRKGLALEDGDAKSNSLKPSRSEFSLLELRGETFVVDRFDHISLKDGLVVLNKLPVGDFDLLLKSTGNHIRIRVTEGPKANHFVLGGHRQLELPRLSPVQIESIESAGADYRLQIRNATPFTRVHVFATRYLPEFDVFAKLGRVRGAEPYIFQQSPAQSVYLTGRNIGDEYRYIIDRKYATKFPGNTLDRPSLLLNPWAVRATETGEQVALSGDYFGAEGAKPTSSAGHAFAPAATSAPPAVDNTPNLDFLAAGTAILVNLVPDKDGMIVLPKDALGGHQYIRVVAVDPINTTARTISLPEETTLFRDLRLAEGLDPKSHFTQQKQISVVPAGQSFTLHDITTSRFEMYDSLSRVYGLYSTLSSDPKLTEFSFLPSWPNLKPEEKRSFYSKYASHELSFFLFKKDPEFFQTVIKPYLANKKDQTFIDRFLLEDDLSSYLQAWRYQQLNVFERILLARRIQDERNATSRHIGDLYALLPQNTDNFIRLFETAIKKSSLDVADVTGLRAKMDSLNQPRFYDANAPLQKSEAAAKNSALGGSAGIPPVGFATPPYPMTERKLKEQLQQRDEKQQDASKKITPRRSGGQALAKDKRSGPKEAEQLGTEDAPVHFFADSDVGADGVQLRQLYRKLEKTMEWAENNYHHLTIDQQNASLIDVSAFWRDYAQHDQSTPFLSKNLAEASRNFPEMLLALAILDLPFESPKHDTKFDGAQMTITPGGPLVVFHEEIRPSAPPEANSKVLVSQNYFRQGDRTRMEQGEQVDKFVSEEFLTQVVYGCQVVITNPSSTRQKLTVLLQIPQGAIAVLSGQATKTVHLNLEPYHTQTIDYHFYFPAAGQFPHFPVHVAKNESLIAAATQTTLNVVEKPTKIDTASWDYISQFGSTEDVLTFLDQHNLNSLNLDRIAWRMNDPKVFDAVLTKLAQRHVYQHALWSYALKHNVVARAREFLMHADQIINDCGGRLRSTLLTIDPFERRTFEHLEYKPLVNARAHSLGKRRQIVNDRFFTQYHRTLKQLSFERSLDDDDLLTVTYYLLLQDRIEEAIATFGRVNVDKVSTKIQYDYCAAYLDFFTDDHKRARSIADKYADHPVDRWRQTFAAITAQLDEAEGKDAKPANEEDRNQQQTQLAATEPSFEFSVEARQIKIDSQNLETVRVNFYEMDVELLFSRNPFVQQFRGQFSSIKPNLTMNIRMSDTDAKSGKGAIGPATKVIPLPQELQNKNVLIEIEGAGVTKTQAYYSHALTAQVIENYGQVKVTQQTTGQPVPKAYVKVYAQMADGTVKFYKDGYTDLRGRFEFASLSTNDLDAATRFSILILSENHGALVREATPPKR